MDSLEATIRIIEAMMASEESPPPFKASRSQAVQRDTIRQDHAQMDAYRQDFIELFKAIHESVSEVAEPKAQ